MAETRKTLRLEPAELIGGLRKERGPTPIRGASWYVADAAAAGLRFEFPAGALAQARYLTADMLLDGNMLGVFALELQEGQEGPTFHLVFALLNQCQARMRMELAAVDQNRWQYQREGAWLKPMCGGDIVDLAGVDRMRIVVLRKAPGAMRFCLTAVRATARRPTALTDPILPKGPLLDELGQSRLHEWPGKSKGPEAVSARLRSQLEAAPSHEWPEEFSRWGGWKKRRVAATGFFRTHHDGKRWWLVDPDGYLFWSAGQDCVSVNTVAACAGLEKALAWMPDPKGEYGPVYVRWRGKVRGINHLAANLIRAFGPGDWHERWSQIALAELRRLRCNTVANWSDWQIARKAGFPYVRPLDYRDHGIPRVFRDFPDVFHPAFAQAAERYAEQLRETADDPALIGYFLMNEPTWGFAEETPAAGMLFNTAECETRAALAGYLREQYGSDAALAAAWGMTVTLAQVTKGAWRDRLTGAARRDLAAFSTAMVDRLFRTLTEACRKVDPHHLNLGARYAGMPPRWALEGMKCFDVFSINCYRERVDPRYEQISAVLGRPVMIGEWHFGALDVGLPASGIGHVKDQQARGKAYRVYLEDAAAKPWCVGAHWFTLYDESALGRFDGENYNIGFLDVCHRPYGPICEAARESHERMYAVASGETPPYDQAPEYLERLFL
jgi:hypothetical protein